MQNILITTSIPYCNSVPHIGFAMELIEADAIARYFRQKGHNVFFLTGADEHGIKIWRTAKEKNLPTQEFVDHNANEFKKLCKILNASNDDFIRTTSERHKQGATKFWEKLAQNNFLEKRKFSGLYCAGCEAFLTEKELQDGKCPNHLKEPELLEEKNWFFKLSEISDKTIELLKKDEYKIIPSYYKKELLEFAKDGLKDISFSRPKSSLPWGIPVPNDDQVMYVWCDALTNYITALDYGKENSNQNLFEKYWNNAKKIHIIGKDILRFHAAFWPAMLMVAEEKTPTNLLVHGFLTSEGQKMSKSLGNVIDPFEIVEKYEADSLRFFLLHEVPFGRDADFSLKRFEEIRNSYLADGLGNLLSRVHTLSIRIGLQDLNSRKKIIEEFQKNQAKSDSFSKIEEELKKAKNKLNDSMENFVLHKAIAAPFEFIAFLNKEINILEPWKLLKSDKEKTCIILINFLESLKEVVIMIKPFLPETADKVSKCLGLDENFQWKKELGEKIILFQKF